METENTPYRDKKIAQVFTAVRILNFEDMSTLLMKKNVIDEGRIKVNLVDLDKDTKKAQQKLWHYANTDGFLLAMDDIINQRFSLKEGSETEWLPIYEEHKGGLGAKIGKPEWTYYASRLLVEFYWTTRGKAIKITMRWCEGEKAPTGIYKPLNHTGELSSSVIVPLFEFRKLAHKIARQVSNVQQCLLYGCGGDIPEFSYQAAAPSDGAVPYTPAAQEAPIDYGDQPTEVDYDPFASE